MVFFKEIEKINTLVLIFEEFENDRPVGRSFSRDLCETSGSANRLILIGEHFSIGTKFQ